MVLWIALFVIHSSLLILVLFAVASSDMPDEDSRTGRVAMNIGPWREEGTEPFANIPARADAQRQLEEYLKNETLYPTLDTSKPYKPTSGYLDEEYHVMVMICAPIQGQAEESHG